MIRNEKLRILFFGTPEFAVASLDALIQNKYDVVAVVTAPDRPAGRGLTFKASEVKNFASKKNLLILQPEDLNDPSFLSQIKSLEPNLGVVVAFRKLPSSVWSLPEKGTFNLHASLLPAYRGAAPINWAIINGEAESGVTTFFLNDEIDAGRIILRAKESINEFDNAGELYARLMKTGADLVLKTVRAIESGNVSTQTQEQLLQTGEKKSNAPKIFKSDCKIDWTKPGKDIYNFIRGLCPYPTAWTELIKGDAVIGLKVYVAGFTPQSHNERTGNIQTDGKTYIDIFVPNGIMKLQELQIAGKKRMTAAELLRGFHIEGWKIHNKSV